MTWYPIKTTPLQVPPAYEPKGGKSAKVKPALLEKGKDKRTLVGGWSSRISLNSGPLCGPRMSFRLGLSGVRFHDDFT